MNLLSLLGSVKEPGGLWITLINWIRSGIGNLGWTIILVTLLVKLVTTPLDFAVKLSTKKQTLIQQKCAPQVAKLQKKFGSDRQALQVQTNAIYKREGLNVGTGCIIMLVNMILSLTIFLTFYNSLRKFSAYEAIYQYEQISDTYEDAYYDKFVNASSNDEFESKDDVITWFNEYNKMPEESDAEKTAKEQKYQEVENLTKISTEYASDKAVEYWKNNKKNVQWLWVQNIWVADSSANLFPDYSALKSIASNTGYTSYVTDNINSANYNKIASLIVDNSERADNGFYILAILAGLITFLSQFISELHNKLKNKKARIIASSAQSANSMKAMKIIMPIIMVVFVLTASASFGLYILASNVASIAFGEITTLIVDKMTKKKRLEVEESLEKEANRLIRKGKIKE